MKNEERGAYAIGGCTLIGVGVAFPFLTINVLYFIGIILGGIGLGLLISALISKEDNNNEQ